jgi:hypothetical protein
MTIVINNENYVRGIYNAKTLFDCPICGKMKVFSESYPYYKTRVCECCWDNIRQKQEEKQEG